MQGLQGMRQAHHLLDFVWIHWIVFQRQMGQRSHLLVGEKGLLEDSESLIGNVVVGKIQFVPRTRRLVVIVIVIVVVALQQQYLKGSVRQVTSRQDQDVARRDRLLRFFLRNRLPDRLRHFTVVAAPPQSIQPNQHHSINYHYPYHNHHSRPSPSWIRPRLLATRRRRRLEGIEIGLEWDFPIR